MLDLKYLNYVTANLVCDPISPHNDLAHALPFELRNDAPR